MVHRRGNKFMLLWHAVRGEEYTACMWPRHTGYKLIDASYLGRTTLRSCVLEGKSGSSASSVSRFSFSKERRLLDKHKLVYGIDAYCAYSQGRYLFPEIIQM